MGRIKGLLYGIRNGETEIRMVFVSSRSTASDAQGPWGSPWSGRRLYVGDWFKYFDKHNLSYYADGKRNRENFLRWMRDATSITDVRVVFRLKEEECNELCGNIARERPSPFQEFFELLAVAVSRLESLKRIQIYVHWTNTFRDAVYRFIRQLLDYTTCRPIEHLGIVYPALDSECFHRYMSGSSINHPSLAHIQVGIMMYNERGRIISQSDAETSIPALPLLPFLGTVLTSPKYTLRTLKEDGETLNADDPELLVTDNLDISVEFGGRALRTISINAIDGCVAKPVRMMFHPYFQNAYTLEMQVNQKPVEVSVRSTTHGARDILNLPPSHEGYSLLAELCNQSQVKSLCFDYNHERNTNYGCFLFAGLKYKLSEINIGSQMFVSSFCNDLLSYLSIYGDENLNLSLKIHEMTPQVWEQWCSDLANEKAMNTLELKIPRLTDLANPIEQEFVSGIRKFIDAKNKIKCLHLDSSTFGHNRHPTTTQVLQCIEELQNKSPMERLEISGICQKLNRDQATQLCNELELNYTLCGNDFHVDKDEPEWKWLELQIWSMFWLNYCGRKYVLLNSDQNQMQEGRKDEFADSDQNPRQDKMNCLCQSVDIPWDDMPRALQIGDSRWDSKKAFLRKLSALQYQWDRDIPDDDDVKKCGFQEMFSLNCMFINLRENPIIFNKPKSKRQAKRPRIENA